MYQASFVTSEELVRLHHRLLSCDVDAREELAALLFYACVGTVYRRLVSADRVTVEDSVGRAIQSYLTDPQSFDPTKSDLQSYIERAALRNAIDQFRSERARHRREALWALEQTRSRDLPDTAKVARTPEEMWPLLIGSRSDLTDQQWSMVEFLFHPKPASGRGRPPKSVRPILNLLIQMLRFGGWQKLPRYSPSSASSRRLFGKWCRSGILRKALDRLEADLRRSRRSH